jgi:hypothetical protein
MLESNFIYMISSRNDYLVFINTVIKHGMLKRKKFLNEILDAA